MTSTATRNATSGHVDAALYRRVQRFYARQMQAIDGGDGVAYGQTFAQDATFVSNALPEPVHGRDTIAGSTGRLARRRLAGGTVRRHVQTMLSVRRPDPASPTLRARSYVLLVETGGADDAGDADGPRLYLSTVCADDLTPDRDSFLVTHRTVLRDDL